MPFFGVGYLHLALLMGAGAAMLGPKELPRAARKAGVLTGRAVGLLVAVKQQASKFAEEAQLEELQKELLETTKQIQSIRSEIRSGWSVQSSRCAAGARPSDSRELRLIISTLSSAAR
mmetsp:Transcript_27/g.232  ORF Transcript_27/g.232 Transcript_27/m.232 type:complete len:118 (+) Transcript_27:2939-3292(+)